MNLGLVNDRLNLRAPKCCKDPARTPTRISEIPPRDPAREPLGKNGKECSLRDLLRDPCGILAGSLRNLLQGFVFPVFPGGPLSSTPCWCKIDVFYNVVGCCVDSFPDSFPGNFFPILSQRFSCRISCRNSRNPCWISCGIFQISCRSTCGQYSFPFFPLRVPLISPPFTHPIWGLVNPPKWKRRETASRSYP